MAQQAPAPPNPKAAPPSNNQAKAKPKAPAGPAPAEEPFWSRYSAHHEFPLSTATSIALHVLALVFLIVAGWWVASLIEKSKLEVGTLEESVFAGGGGSRQGEGKDAGDRPPASENVDTSPTTEPPKPTAEVAPLDPIKKQIADPLDVILQD